VAKARAIPSLNEEDPYALGAARVVAVRADELRDHAAGVLDIADIERVHDMRVATRRLRAALEVFEPCFPREQFKPALREVKALADALGERRDRDVAIAALSRIEASFAAADRSGVESLIDRLRGEQDEANEALAPFVSDERLAALGARLAELVEAARATAGAPPEAAPGATELAAASAGNGSGVATTAGDAR
jgi:CHAD domain-containing protein